MTRFVLLDVPRHKATAESHGIDTTGPFEGSDLDAPSLLVALGMFDWLWARKFKRTSWAVYRV